MYRNKSKYMISLTSKSSLLTSLFLAHDKYPADQYIVCYCMQIFVPLRFDSGTEISECFVKTECWHLCSLVQAFQDKNHTDHLNFMFSLVLATIRWVSLSVLPQLIKILLLQNWKIFQSLFAFENVFLTMIVSDYRSICLLFNKKP